MEENFIGQMPQFCIVSILALLIAYRQAKCQSLGGETQTARTANPQGQQDVQVKEILYN